MDIIKQRIRINAQTRQLFSNPPISYYRPLMCFFLCIMKMKYEQLPIICRLEMYIFTLFIGRR